jgi:hypothetical protein
MSGDQTILAAILAALVATIGYWAARQGQRNDQRASLYAEALDAVDKYMNVPFLVYWRADSTPDTRSRLHDITQERILKMLYYRGLLRLHSPLVAEAYNALVTKTRAESSVYRQRAWKVPVAKDDAEYYQDSPAYDYHNEQEYTLCVEAMRGELSFFSPLSRRRLLRQLAAQQPSVDA